MKVFDVTLKHILVELSSICAESFMKAMFARCFKGSWDLVPGKMKAWWKASRLVSVIGGADSEWPGSVAFGKTWFISRAVKNSGKTVQSIRLILHSKKLCLSRIYRVRTTAVSICKTAEENHLNIDRNIIIRLLSYLAGTSPLFKSGSHVKAISSTLLKEWHTVKQSDSQGNFVFGEGFKILHLVCHVTGEKERLKTIHLKKFWRQKAKCSL